jgi:ABC-type glycerol-3-phosphate transport system permease component
MPNPLHIQGSNNWVNTFLPLTIPSFTGGTFNIFLLRQFMRGIPMELSEAAKIDGASELRVWWDIIMPLSKPAPASIAIFTFQGAWQDFMAIALPTEREVVYFTAWATPVRGRCGRLAGLALAHGSQPYGLAAGVDYIHCVPALLHRRHPDHRHGRALTG